MATNQDWLVELIHKNTPIGITLCERLAAAIREKIEAAIAQTPSRYFDSPYEAYVEVSEIRKALLGGEDVK